MGKDKNDEVNIGDKIAGFLQRNRKLLFVLLIIIAGGVASSVTFFLIRGVLEKKAIAKVEILEQRKNELGSIDESVNHAEVEALLKEINDFTPSAFGYAAAKAYSLEADIYFSRSEWEKAEKTWMLAARKTPKIYLAPMSLFNAAVAAEEQGKLEAALEYLNQSLDFEGINPVAARARFNIGRIHEERYNKDSAREVYSELIEKNPGSPWANLAQNRLIILEKN